MLFFELLTLCTKRVCLSWFVTRDNARKYVNCLLSNFKLSDALFFSNKSKEDKDFFFFF